MQLIFRNYVICYNELFMLKQIFFAHSALTLWCQ